MDNTNNSWINKYYIEHVLPATSFTIIKIVLHTQCNIMVIVHN
jgi:hypothetical protein